MTIEELADKEQAWNRIFTFSRWQLGMARRFRKELQAIAAERGKKP